MKPHLLIFIHGIGEGPSTKYYRQLLNNIGRYYQEYNQVDQITFQKSFLPVFVEWQRYISNAERELFKLCFPDLPTELKTANVLRNPMFGLRYFMTLFLGDVTAYVAVNDNKIRSSVWHDMKRALAQYEGYSIIAHSLGSIVAYDYVFNLLVRNVLFLADFHPQPPAEEIVRLQNNFTHLFTLGAPIGLFMMRQGELWMEERNFRDIINPVQGSHRRWLNFHNNCDPIAYPLEKLFAQNSQNSNCFLQDIHVQTGNLVVNSHLNYWQNDKVAQQIARTLSLVHSTP